MSHKTFRVLFGASAVLLLLVTVFSDVMIWIQKENLDTGWYSNPPVWLKAVITVGSVLPIIVCILGIYAAIIGEDGGSPPSMDD